MGWKNVKEHYRIGHIVQVREGDIVIGSPYVSALIAVSPDGTITKYCDCTNEDLTRYLREFEADPTKLRELVAAPDSFTRSLPVFTYDEGQVIEKQCEEFGWPNITHDGCLMYENTFSHDKMKVVQRAKVNCRAGIKLFRERIIEQRKKLSETEGNLARDEAALAKLDAEFPGV